jgi:CBS domain-containing protein
MQVYEAMTPDVVSVGPATTLAEAARMMRTLHVGPLPVCDDGRIIGVLTDRDITVRATAEGLDPITTPVGDVMTPEVLSCQETDDVADAALKMQMLQVRRLIVLDEQGRLAGIVSIGDIALQGQDESLTGRTLERVSTPSPRDT